MIACRWAVTTGAALVLMWAPTLATAQTASGVPVAARDLPRGIVLTAEDVLIDAGVGAPNVIGWLTRRVIGAGEPLIEPAIARPDLIRVGDSVQLVWRDGSMEIRVNGKAMGGAAEGEKVLVRVDGKRRFEGIASAPGEVRLASTETK